MTEEIKEIFYKLRSDEYYKEHYQQSVYYERDLKKLENYITNLQKENTDLKKLCDKYEEEHKTTFETWKKVIARNEKAIEYIKAYYLLNDNEFNMKNVLNILQGGDE